QSADPRFSLTDENRAAIEEICERLDRLPLAVELAAARTKLLPPEAMLALLDERLELLGRGARDLPERHQALRNTIAWSDNLRGALEWLLESGDRALGLRFAAALWEFWWVRGYLAEGRRWLDKALEKGADQPAELRARALHAAASLANRQGDYERAAALSE